jgi:hypothetical protein
MSSLTIAAIAAGAFLLGGAAATIVWRRLFLAQDDDIKRLREGLEDAQAQLHAPVFDAHPETFYVGLHFEDLRAPEGTAFVGLLVPTRPAWWLRYSALGAERAALARRVTQLLEVTAQEHAIDPTAGEDDR